MHLFRKQYEFTCGDRGMEFSLRSGCNYLGFFNRVGAV